MDHVTTGHYLPQHILRAVNHQLSQESVASKLFRISSLDRII